MGFFGWVFFIANPGQEELTGRIAYDLYAIGLGILMITASLLIDPFHAIFTGQFVGCWALMIAGCHPLVCSVAESSLCDRRQLIAGPVPLAILLCGSILIALLIVQIGSSIAEVESLCRAFREEVLSNYII